MDDPNIIAVLLATKSGLTEQAFQLQHNKERYRAPPLDDRPFSRENTPEYPQEVGDKKDDAAAHRITLSFDKPPKNAKLGYVFGWGADCDIQLVDRENRRPGDRKKVERVSKRHFSITFDKQRRVILQDSSKHGTIVNYESQAQNEIRRNFTWIIFPDCKTIEVSILDADISFVIMLRQLKNCNEEYRANIDRVFPPSVRIAQSRLATPMQQLVMDSQRTSVTASGRETPRNESIYLKHERIGKGAFGKVHRVTNVSTGDDYAGKFIDDSNCAREVTVMKTLNHEHIVRFVDYCETPSPVIYMEYLSMGSLDDVHTASPIDFEEMLAVLVQGLQALTYLNSLGVIHRDIKPANMLVSSRSPLIIKLADLGIAKHDRNGFSEFKTRVGTPGYAAPEVWEGEGKPYTDAADIWSLGVVALELAYGLPNPTSHWGNWSSQIIHFVEALASDPLIDFLSSSMLLIEPTERLRASACLEEVLSIQSKLRLEKAIQSPSTRNTSQLGAGTPTENASVSTTFMGKSSLKRQRSPHSSDATSNKRTTSLQGRDHQIEFDNSYTYPIADASLWFDGQHGTMCESVLKLLKDIQIDSDGATDSHTFELVLALCRTFERLQIREIKKSFGLDTEQTILTAITETKAFPLASLNFSELANSVNELADHLLRIVNLLVSDRSNGDAVGRLSPEDGGEKFDLSSV